MATKFERITLWTAVETYFDENDSRHKALSALDWIVENIQESEPEVHLLDVATEEYVLTPKPGTYYFGGNDGDYNKTLKPEA